MVPGDVRRRGEGLFSLPPYRRRPSFRAWGIPGPERFLRLRGSGTSRRWAGRCPGVRAEKLPPCELSLGIRAGEHLTDSTSFTAACE